MLPGRYLRKRLAILHELPLEADGEVPDFLIVINDFLFAPGVFHRAVYVIVCYKGAAGGNRKGRFRTPDDSCGNGVGIQFRLFRLIKLLIAVQTDFGVKITETGFPLGRESIFNG